MQAAQENPGLLNRTLDLCTCSLLLGAYEKTITLAKAALAHNIESDIATAFIALARGIQGDVDAAYDYGCRLDKSGSRHPVILQARMLSLLLKAAKLGGVADTNELMKSAGELFLELPAEPNDPETTLLLARANVAFPDFANSPARAITALGKFKRLLECEATPAELPVEGLAESVQQVYRIYVMYYLGVLHEMSGHGDTARDCFEQVIQIDPASSFGEKAFLQLAQLQHNPSSNRGSAEP